MSQPEVLQLARAFLTRLGSGVEPTKLAELFSEDLEWEVADTLLRDWNATTRMTGNPSIIQ